MDVYNLWESLEAIIKYLRKVDPAAVKTEIEAYRCFEPYGRNVEDYARATAFVPDSCEEEVIDMLIDLRSKAAQYKSDGIGRSDLCEQNAIVAKNAELYHRKMIEGGTTTWNIRDTHMMDTLKSLMEFYGKDHSNSIVWAHNTHVGDTWQTDMTDAKMINLGQVVREYACEKNVILVGFGTYKGTVIAAKEWGKSMEKMHVPPAIEGSWDSPIHNQGKCSNRDTKDQLLTEDKRSKRTVVILHYPKFFNSVGEFYEDFEQASPKGQEKAFPGSSNTFTVTFEKAGRYDYFCMVHPWMFGTVIVK